MAVTALAGALGVFVVGSPARAVASGGSGSTGATGATGATGVGATGVTGTSTKATTTTAPSPATLAAGKTLFVQNCATCHEPNGVGSGRAPNLQGVGAATVDLWLSSGWMPLAEPAAQPETKPPRFDRQQIDQIVAFVTSLAPGGVPIPVVDPAAGNVQTGFDLFALNCAGCHTITGAGDELAAGLRAPSLHGVSATEIAEAIETGPGNMPRFSSRQLSAVDVNSIVNYVLHYIQTPTNPGGLGLGGVGPVAEGFVGLFVGVGACMLIGFWVGDRTEKDEDEEHGHGDGHVGSDDGAGHGAGGEGDHAAEETATGAPDA